MDLKGKEAMLLTDYLDKTAQQMPQKIALVDGDRRVCYRDLWRDSKKLALKIPNEMHNRPIAVLLPKSSNAILSFFSVLYSGNFYVPLDLSSPINRLRRICEQIQAEVIITDAQHHSLALDLGLDAEILLIDDALKAFEPTKNQELSFHRKVLNVDPAYCIFTSGSTGTPKGVLISHQSVVDYISWAIDCFAINADERVANQAPFHFDNSILDIFASVATGAELHLIPQNVFAFPAATVEYLRLNRISMIFWVPTLLKLIASVDVLQKESLPDLRKILFAGEVMSCKTLNFWKSKVPQALYANLYGPTETTVDCAYFVVDRVFSDVEELPIGQSRRNVQLLVLDEENKLVEGGEIGELCVRGSALAIGYWDEPRKTEEVFVQNPLHTKYADPIYRTGDLVKYNERGELMFRGRKDHQIKLSGYRIELGEIEAVALQAPEVIEAVATFNQMSQQLWLFYSSSQSERDNTDLRQILAENLPKYMVPSVLMRLDELPLLSNGKIDRVGLAAMTTRTG